MILYWGSHKVGGSPEKIPTRGYVPQNPERKTPFTALRPVTATHSTSPRTKYKAKKEIISRNPEFLTVS
jgi:hypothetical protein